MAPLIRVGCVPEAANQNWRGERARSEASYGEGLLCLPAPTPQIPYDSNARSQQAHLSLHCATRWRNTKDGAHRNTERAVQKYDYNTAEPQFDDSIHRAK